MVLMWQPVKRMLRLEEAGWIKVLLMDYMLFYAFCFYILTRQLKHMFEHEFHKRVPLCKYDGADPTNGDDLIGGGTMLHIIDARAWQQLTDGSPMWQFRCLISQRMARI